MHGSDGGTWHPALAWRASRASAEASGARDRALRILHVTPYYHDAWAYGGIPRVVSALARAQARLGHAVTVCTTDAGTERRLEHPDGQRPRLRPWSALGADGLRIHVFPNVSNRLAYNQLFMPMGLSCLPATTRGVVRCGAPARVSQHSGRRCRARDAARARALCARAERHGAANRAAARGQAPVRSGGRPARTGVSAPRAGGDRDRAPATRNARRPGTAASRDWQSHRPRRIPSCSCGRRLSRTGRRWHCTSDPLSREAHAAQARGRGRACLRCPRRRRRPTRAGGQRHGSRREHPPARRRVQACASACASPACSRAGTGSTPSPLPMSSCTRRLTRSSASCRSRRSSAARPVIVGDDSGCAEVLRDVEGTRAVPLGDPYALRQAISEGLASQAWRSAAVAGGARIASRYGSRRIAELVDAMYREILGPAIARRTDA